MTQTRAPGQNAGTPKPPPPRPTGSSTLTGRGAVLALFAACFSGLLITAWTGWSDVANVVFVMSCGVVTCYTRASGLRAVVVCPPLAFFAGSVLAEVLTAPSAFLAAERVLVLLGRSAPWLFTGTALTIAIALRRGSPPQRRRPRDPRHAADRKPARAAERRLAGPAVPAGAWWPVGSAALAVPATSGGSSGAGGCRRPRGPGGGPLP